VAALPPGTAEVRRAVRAALSALPPDSLVLVACSGGADSLALAAQAAFVAPRLCLRAGLVTVDHDLQPGSAARAASVAGWASTNFNPVSVVRVNAAPTGDGPEAAARSARYEALLAAAKDSGATAILLGHTRDDQAETVLLAMARGAGPRGLAGMPARRDLHGVALLRPLLDVPRSATRLTCEELDLPVWEDPHNADPRYTRSRVRAALPMLADLLGDGFVTNLATTARLAAADSELLDSLAADAYAAAAVSPFPSKIRDLGREEPSVPASSKIRDLGASELRIDALAALPAALRTRVLRLFAIASGGGRAVISAHIDALDALVTDWHGQGGVALPGGCRIVRRGNVLRASARPAEEMK
jgi:tRNA(Ile)-lysidine synthase